MRTWHQIIASPRASFGLVGLIMAGILVLAALAPGWLAPYDPYELVGPPFARPSDAFPLGTNDIGQDLFSELIWSSRVSITVGVAAGLLSTLGGLLLGILAGFLRGWVEAVIMRCIDIILVIPFLPLMILLGSFIGPSMGTLILVISLTSWAGPARVIRAQVMSVRAEDYVEASRAMGARSAWIMWRHVLPQVLPLGLAQFVGATSAAILTEAALSFLGLGDPTAKSWGTMLQFAQARGAFFTGAWVWWVIPPGVCIMAATVSFALVGLVLEEALDPRLRES